jgi:hypothetical protein
MAFSLDDTGAVAAGGRAIDSPRDTGDLEEKS